MVKRATQEEFIKKANDTHNGKYGYSKVVYTGNRQKVIITCPIHGDFEQKANNHLNGNECSRCAEDKKFLTTEQFIEKANLVHNNKFDYTNTKYVRSKQKITIICRIHGEFTILANAHLNGQGCQTCGKYGNMSNETLAILKQPKIILEMNKKLTYSQIAEKIGATWSTVQRSILSNGYFGRHNSSRSSKELEIYHYITETLGVKAISGDRNVLKGKEIDIFIPDKKIAIEFNGVYYHSEANPNYTKDKHKEKLLSLNTQGIRLIQIWEDDYMFRKDVVLSFIRNALGCNPIKLNARECIIKNITQTDYYEFLEKHHLLGGHNSASIRLGLFDKENNLVSVMGFKRYREHTAFELVRFSSVGVRGAFSKLECHFIKTFRPSEIVSFADLEIVDSKSNVYTSNGYTVLRESRIDYKYYGCKLTEYRRQHKFLWRKSKFKKLLGDIGDKTELDLATEMKLFRTWDSGKILYSKVI